MKVLLIMPDSHMHVLRVGTFVRSMREAPLTLTTLAALVPEELDIDLTLVDETVSTVPADGRFDLVGISIMTGTAERGYAWAKHFRERGATVVIGGVHATIMPDEAAGHADAVVAGVAERTWPELLSDFSAGRMRKMYSDHDQAACIDLVPTPRSDLLKRWRYNVPQTVMATRGCRHACEFCSVPAMWRGYHKRPISQVVADIKALRGRLLAFNDVSLFDDRQYARELMDAITPLKRKWGGLATADVADDDDLVDQMARSGCKFLLIGFESLAGKALRGIGKAFNREKRYRRQIAALQSRGITVQGCFIFGFDSDEITVFDETVQRVAELKVDIPRYSIFTPYPGTRLFDRMESENRIISRNWSDYDTMHVVFRPEKMSPQELYDGFRRAYRMTFRMKHIIRRMPGLKPRGVINLVGNLTYKQFVRRLYNEKRFSEPNSAAREDIACLR
jgi:radical SAM superfamily enzyme YgiQ (UPF0313 family)